MAKRSKKKKTSAPTKKEIARSRREREQQRRILIGTGAVGVLIVIVLAVGVFQEYIGKQRAPIATVNGVNISTAAFQKEVRYRRYNLLQAFGGLGSNAVAQLSDYLAKQLPQQVLDNMIENELIRQEAQRRGIKVSREEIDRAIEERFGYYRVTPTPSPTPTLNPSATITATATPPPTATPVTQEAFKKEYADYLLKIRNAAGFSEADFRRSIEANLLREKVREAITADLPSTAPQARVRHILVQTEEDARKVYERLKGGEDFAKVAQEASLDPLTGSEGGDMGWVLADDLDPELAKVVFSIPIGEISEPVQTARGWEIVQVLERDDNRPLTPEQLESLRSRKFNEWLNEQLAQADIRRFFSEDKVPPLHTPRPPES